MVALTRSPGREIPEPVATFSLASSRLPAFNSSADIRKNVPVNTSHKHNALADDLAIQPVSKRPGGT
jgi:hypothetical protein